MKVLPDIIEVRVGPSHIKRGKQLMSSACPIALAVEGLIRHRWADIYVDDVVVNIWDGDEGEVEYLLPVAATLFVQEFDAGGRKAVRPFTFCMERKTP